jgi:glycosyltransferase involved in cell wall biosynthesis
MENNTRILLVLPFFYPHRGGSQKYAEELYAKLMQNHPKVSVDVLAYNTDNTESYEEYRGFRIHRIPCFNVIPARFALPNPYHLLRKLRELSKNDYDFVNTHIRFFDPTWWLWAYARMIKAQSIFTGHVATHPVYQSRLVELVAKTVDLTVAGLSLKFYDYLTFTNKTAEKFFKERLYVTKETFLVYGGVDTDYFKPAEKNAPRRVPQTGREIPEDGVLITFVGRMIWTKGVTFLYEAAKEVLSRTENKEKVYFVMAGPGELEEELRARASEDGLQDSIILTGNLSYEQVRDLLAVTDIFVNPSHHNEGFPNTVLEAGSSGAYVVATDNAGTWEVIKNGETGSLIPQKDTPSLVKVLLYVIDNKELRVNIALKFREELVRHFDWNVISEKYFNLLVKWKK